MMKKFFLSNDFIFIIIIIFFSLWIRWYNISSLPYDLEGDELSWISTSLFHKYNIQAADKGLWSMHDTLALATPVTIRINQLSFLLFGIDIISARKMLAIFSVFSLITFYILCRKFLTATISFFITMIYSFSTFKLITSKIAMIPSYSDIFVYLAILLLIFRKGNKNNYLYIFFSSVLITLSLFIYNLAYWLPIFGITLIIFQALKEKMSLKKLLLLLVVFLIPIIATSPKWYTNIKEEQNRKSYALRHNSLDLINKRLNLNKFVENAKIINSQLTKGLRYETSDMLIRHTSTIVSLPITILAILGILISLFKIKTYFPILAWFILSFLPIILFGFFLPRMWLNTFGSIFVLAAVPIDLFWQKVSNKKEVAKYLFFIILLLGSALIINSEVNIFFLQVVKNPSFSTKNRDIFELAKKAQTAPKETVFISDADTNRQLVYPAMTFYYLAVRGSEAEKIKKFTEEDMNILTFKWFKETKAEDIKKYKTIIIDNQYLDKVNSTLQDKQIIPKKIIRGSNFTELLI